MTSEKQKQYCKERYEWLKSKGICVHCGREKAVSGQILCPACKVRHAEVNKNCRRRLTSEQKEKIKQYSSKRFHERYAERLEKNLCVYCGKRPPEENHTRCEICLEAARKDYHKHKEKRRENAKKGEN